MPFVLRQARCCCAAPLQARPASTGEPDMVRDTDGVLAAAGAGGGDSATAARLSWQFEAVQCVWWWHARMPCNQGVLVCRKGLWQAVSRA